MMIAARNAFLMGGAKLPYDAEVEYLESTGTQWIDTEAAPDYTTDFWVSATVTPLNDGRKVIAGNFTDGSSYEDRRAMSALEFGGISNGYPFHPRGWFKPNRQAGYSIFANDPVPRFSIANIKIEYSLATNTCRLITDDNQYSEIITKQNMNPGRGLRLFSDYRTNKSPIAFGCRIYAVQISIANTLVRDFIPVRIGTTGYMFDRAGPTGGPLGNGLYPNSGTGSFVLGPDK